MMAWVRDWSAQWLEYAKKLTRCAPLTTEAVRTFLDVGAFPHSHARHLRVSLLLEEVLEAARNKGLEELTTARRHELSRRFYSAVLEVLLLQDRIEGLLAKENAEGEQEDRAFLAAERGHGLAVRRVVAAEQGRSL